MPLILFAFAIAAGGWLRFANLDARDLSPDEAASWAAASAPSLSEVLRLQARLNPGELGLHDVALHFWMRFFGDGLAAMRSLSALCGTIAVLLVFFDAREIIYRDDADSEELFQSDLIAAVAALFVAVNLVTIKYSREARMYPLALVLVLAQVGFFLRGLRRGELRYYVAIAVTTALAFAATFSTVLILAPEAFFLAITWRYSKLANPRWIGSIAAGLVVGLILAAPAIAFYLEARGGAPGPGTWQWIPEPAPWAGISLFNKATGTYVFPLLAILALLGVARGWQRHGQALIFLLLWTLLPAILLTIISYVFRPAFVERYLLSSFAPFFILAAIGVMYLEPAAMRPGAIAIVLALALSHFVEWQHKPHGAEWNAAAQAAVSALAPRDTIGVAPRYAVNVVRYDLRELKPPPLVEPFDSDPSPAVVVVAEDGSPTGLQLLTKDYPRLLAHPRGVVVRGR